MTPTEGLKITNVPEVPLKPKGVLKVQWKEKGVETMSFAEAVKSTPRRAGESVWLEVGEKEVGGRRASETLRDREVGFYLSSIT